MNVGPSTRFSVPDYGFGKAFAPFAPKAPAAGEAAAKDSEPAKAETAAGEKTQEKPKVAELSPAEQARIEDLKKIDRRVRAHEAAHLLAGDGVVRGGASFSYVTGPDGKSYAVGGEVSIDASPGQTPQETIDKAAAIARAALAPIDPSAQDRRVAAAATAMAATARAELASQRLKEAQAASGGDSGERGAAFYQRVQRDEDLSQLLAVA